MKINDWINRCAARYEQRAGLSKKEARIAAFVSLTSTEDVDVTTEETPEEFADEDMDCWGEEK